MRWFRSHVRSGAWLALAALALQLALTFAHVHAPALGRTSAQAASPSDPSHPEPTGIGIDQCAICAVAQMAGSLIPTISPVLPPLTPTGDARLSISIDRPHATSPPPLFQARAPPLV